MDLPRLLMRQVLRQAPGRAQPPFASGIEVRDAAAIAPEAGQKFETARQSVEAGARAEREKREHYGPPRHRDVSRQALAKHARRCRAPAQTSASDEGIRRIAQSLDEVRGSFEAAQAEFQAFGIGRLAQEVAALRDNVNRERAAYAEARARHDGLEREASPAERISAIELKPARGDGTTCVEQIEHLTTRAQENPQGHCRTCRMPQILADKRRP